MRRNCQVTNRQKKTKRTKTAKITATWKIHKREKNSIHQHHRIQRQSLWIISERRWKKILSASQRDQVYLNITKTQLKLKQTMVDQLTAVRKNPRLFRKYHNQSRVWENRSAMVSMHWLVRSEITTVLHYLQFSNPTPRITTISTLPAFGHHLH